MKNTLPNVLVYDGSLFTWKREGAGIADVSDLSSGVPWARVFKDAADVGFYVVSHKTGAKKLFTLNQVVREEESEIIAWVFLSEDEAVRLTVFND